MSAKRRCEIVPRKGQKHRLSQSDQSRRCGAPGEKGLRRKRRPLAELLRLRSLSVLSEPARYDNAKFIDGLACQRGSLALGQHLERRKAVEARQLFRGPWRRTAGPRPETG